MRKHLRQLTPGQQFILLRTGECCTFLRREVKTPSGIRYIVRNNDRGGEISLHHACHVAVGSPEGVLA